MNNNNNEKNTITNTIIEGQSTAEKLICIICYNLPFKPQYLNCCEQIICLNCIVDTLKVKFECPFCRHQNPTFSVPNKFVFRIFDEIIMKCRYTDCEEKLNYSNIFEHEMKCPKNPKPTLSNQIDFSLNLHNHKLIYTDERNGNNYSNGFSCDFCNLEFNKFEKSYNCAKCQVDVCKICYDYALRGKKQEAIHHHALLIRSSDEEIVCDICEIELDHTMNWNCLQCNFNICIKCYWKH